jgi:hypothetical protein
VRLGKSLRLRESFLSAFHHTCSSAFISQSIYLVDPFHGSICRLRIDAGQDLEPVPSNCGNRSQTFIAHQGTRSDDRVPWKGKVSMQKLFSSYAVRLFTQGYRTALVGAFLAIAVVISAFSLVPPANAASFAQQTPTLHTAVAIPDGTNGQQLEVRTLAFSVKIKGTNQNGQTVTHCFNTPNYDTELTGWWWKGTITIWSYDSGGCRILLNEMTRYVPTSFSGEYYPIQVTPY